ncbi:hypothetical protein [Marinococcus halotolerans]|jgi:hypothetical protein|uniref:hypothetical protein n=1 Tax=Marinococcus halotolerans TaxID=301092 RepID=UPI0003B65D8F|nr:hypothetical protein [Marinococcus halotolerans]
MYTQDQSILEVLFPFALILIVWFIFDGLLRQKTRLPYKNKPKRRRSKSVIIVEKSLEWTGSACVLFLTIGSGNFLMGHLIFFGLPLALVQLIQAIEQRENIPETKAHWHSFLGAVFATAMVCRALVSFH